MRIRVFSDLHTEMAAFEPPPVGAVDVVVLAGDIGVKTHGLTWAQRTFTDPDVPVIYVLGNHEYYGGAVPSLTHKLRALASGSHFHVLDENDVVIRGVRFLGATLWTDFALFGVDRRGECMDAAQSVMTDYHRIRRSPEYSKLRPRDSLSLHRRARAWLATELVKPHDGPTVIVTHHAPAASGIQDQHRHDLLSAAYASDVGELLDGRATLWIHGHTHHFVDEIVRGTRVVSNQRGYPDEPADGFDPTFVVVIGAQ